jgi:hypothetical protein
MSEGFEQFLGKIAGAARAQRAFVTAYEAGKDCAVNGPNEANCHFVWFASDSSKAEWERGKRDGETG